VQRHRLRSHKALESFRNAKGISVDNLPDDVQTQLKAVVREIRKLDAVTL
jgi:hypothetical protein